MFDVKKEMAVGCRQASSLFYSIAFSIIVLRHGGMDVSIGHKCLCKGAFIQLQSNASAVIYMVAYCSD